MQKSNGRRQGLYSTCEQAVYLGLGCPSQRRKKIRGLTPDSFLSGPSSCDGRWIESQVEVDAVLYLLKEEDKQKRRKQVAVPPVLAGG